MAYATYEWAGVIVAIISVIILIIGIVVLSLDQTSNKPVEWWVWALIVIGIVGILIGIAFFFIPNPMTPIEEHALRKLQSGTYPHAQTHLGSVGCSRPDPVCPPPKPKCRKLVITKPEPTCSPEIVATKPCSLEPTCPPQELTVTKPCPRPVLSCPY